MTKPKPVPIFADETKMPPPPEEGGSQAVLDWAMRAIRELAEDWKRDGRDLAHTRVNVDVEDGEPTIGAFWSDERHDQIPVEVRIVGPRGSTSSRAHEVQI